MILIKTANHKFSERDELIEDKSPWRNLDEIKAPIRRAAASVFDEITVEDVRSKVEGRIKAGLKEGRIKYLPTLRHGRILEPHPFVIKWKYVEESPLPSTDGSGGSPPPNN